MTKRGQRDEQGFVMVWFALLLVPLMLMAALSVDVGRWYVVVGKEQKAADAAALAGVVHMPGDLAQGSIVALAIADQNGFSAARGDTVAVTATSQPNQLRVTITTTVQNFFASVVGIDKETITRSAVAEFQGPTPMGSPSNTLGNEPVIPGEDGDAWRDTDNPVADNPQHWLEISGPKTPKIEGDRYSANNCSSSPYACSGSNDEWSEKGYFFVVRVRATAADVGKHLAVQLYDPALVHTGDLCTEGMPAVVPPPPPPVTDPPTPPPVVPPDPAASSRYTTREFCTGDHMGSENVHTDFQLFQPTPQDLYGSATALEPGCVKGWDSFKGDIRAEMTANPNGMVATTFHRWNDLCRVTIAAPGVQDYLLQVRTTGGNGHNRYAIRTGLTTTSGPAIPPAVESRPDGDKTSMFAAGRLPIFANLNAAKTTFYLARLLPGSGGSTLRVGFYDTGDAAAPGILSVRPATDAVVRTPAGDTPLTRFPKCVTTKSDGNNPRTDPGDPTGCTLVDVKNTNGYNGQLVQMLVSIPDGYWCDQTKPLACWATVSFTYTSGVNDTTTWDATIDGDPVRLVK